MQDPCHIQQVIAFVFFASTHFGSEKTFWLELQRVWACRGKTALCGERDRNASSRSSSDRARSGSRGSQKAMSGASANEHEVDAIFDVCDADLSCSLDRSESKYALRALGLYPQKSDIKSKAQGLGLQFPFTKPAFRKVAWAHNSNYRYLGVGLDFLTFQNPRWGSCE